MSHEHDLFPVKNSGSQSFFTLLRGLRDSCRRRSRHLGRSVSFSVRFIFVVIDRARANVPPRTNALH